MRRAKIAERIFQGSMVLTILANIVNAVLRHSIDVGSAFLVGCFLSQLFYRGMLEKTRNQRNEAWDIAQAHSQAIRKLATTQGKQIGNAPFN